MASERITSIGTTIEILFGIPTQSSALRRAFARSPHRSLLGGLGGLPLAIALVVAVLGASGTAKAQDSGDQASIYYPYGVVWTTSRSEYNYITQQCGPPPPPTSPNWDDFEKCLLDASDDFWYHPLTAPPPPKLGAGLIPRAPSLSFAHERSSADPSSAFAPTLTTNVAVLPFLGNWLVGAGYVINSPLAVADTTAAYLTALRRQSDCSLDEDYFLVGSTTPDAGYLTSLTGAQDYLHQLAGLTTTPDVFANGCGYQVLGLPASTQILLLGNTSSGAAISAQLANGGVYVSVTTLTANTNTLLPNTSTATGFFTASLRSNNIFDLIVPGLIDPTTSQPATAVFLGNGDGTFQTPVYYDGVTAASIDDVNGDGIPDIVSLVVSNITYGTTPPTNSGTVSTLLGKGDGTFTAGPAANSVTWSSGPVMTGEFTSSGFKDILAAGTVLFGAGNGSFTQGPTNTAIATASYSNGFLISNAVGNLRNNGKLDVVVSQPGQVNIFYGNGDGTFTAGPSYAGLPDVEQVTISDLDGDGNLDIELGSSTGGIYTFGGQIATPMYQVLMGRGDGTFVDSQDYPLAPFSLKGYQPAIASADFNGDGNADVLYFDTAGTLDLLPGDGKGDLGALVTSPINLSPKILIAADMNGDGKPDAVLTGNSSGGTPTLSVLINQGNGTFAQEQDYTLPNTAISAAVGDFNGDGRMDVAVGFTGTDAGVWVLFGQSNGTLGTPVQIDSSLNPTGLAAGRLTTDGRTDLVVADQGVYDYVGASDQVNGALHVYLGNAGGTFTTATQPSTKATNYTVAALGDLDNDGKLDLIVVGNVAGASISAGGAPTVYTLLGNGDGTFKTATALALAGSDGIGATSIAMADYNNDGNLDVAVGNPLDSTEVLLGNGDGTLEDTGLALGQQPVTVAAAYLTGKTFPALLVGQQAPSSENLAVFLNTNPWVPATSTLAASTTALTASATTVTPGANVTLTATVTGPTGNTTVPTGTVTFMLGTTTLGTQSLNSSGVAQFMTTTLPVGSDSITAVYSGDTNFSGSTSSAVVVTVSTTPVKTATTTTLSASATTITAATSVTFTATVMPTSGTPTPTGTVTFKDGTTTLGTGAVNGSGVATYATSALSVGSHSITASYGGDTLNTTSVSNAVTVTVTVIGTAASPTFNLAAGTYYGTQSVTLADTTPGAMIYYTTDGSTPPTSSTSTLYSDPISVTASETINAIAVAPDYNNSTVVSAAYVISQQPPTYTIAFSPSTLTIADGQSASTTITVTPQNGFNAPVSFACTGQTLGVSCAFSSATVTPSNNQPATTTLTISTFGAPGSLARRQAPNPLFPGMTLALALCLFGWRKRRGILQLVLLLAVGVAGLSLLNGCGGSAQKPHSTAVVVQTSSGSIQQSATLTIIVDY